MTDNQLKLQRYRGIDNKVALFRNLESVRDLAASSENAVQELRQIFEHHISLLSQALENLKTEKISRDELQEQLNKLLAVFETGLKQIQLIPGPKGDNGDSYVLTEKDLAEIALRVKPNTEKIIEKTEVIRETPVVKEVAVTDTAEVIRAKILDVGLPVAAIEGLDDKLKELRKIGATKMPLGGFNKNSMDFHLIDDETPSGTVNGSNTIFILANIPNPATSLKVYVNGQRMRITEDFTLSGATITFVTAPPTNSIILCDYRI